MKVLATNSGPDVNWLMDVFGLDLSLLARLGGHSAQQGEAHGEGVLPHVQIRKDDPLARQRGRGLWR